MTKRPGVGIGVLIVNSRNKLLLGKRKNSHGAGTWCLAGGHLEFGESFETCAIREVWEETGLKIENPQFLMVTNDVFEKEERHFVTILMRAAFSGDQEVENREPHKTEEWQWFDRNALPSNLFLPILSFFPENGYGGTRVL